MSYGISSLNSGSATLANSTAEYCKKGDIIGVKGRLQTQLYNKEDGSTVKITKVVAEKITFLSSKKEDE